MGEEICENCKHWLLGHRTWYAVSEHSWIKCKNQDVGMCLSEKIVYADLEDTPIDGASYKDGENYQASFMTGRNFGCIHFEG